MTRVALVSGPRILAAHDPAREWLLAQFDAFDPSRVFMGDAAGADDWGHRWAKDHARGWERYQLNGDVERWRPPWWSMGGWVRFDDEPSRGTKRWPLRRNAAMVRDVAALVLSDVRVFAPTCPQSKTKGTLHTLGLARKAGLVVVTQPFELTETR